MEFPPTNGSLAFARLGKDGQEFTFESFNGNIRELLQATEEIVLTCAGKDLNNGRWRFLQYWKNKRVKMIRGTVKPAATGDFFRANTPRQMI